MLRHLRLTTAVVDGGGGCGGGTRGDSRGFRGRGRKQAGREVVGGTAHVGIDRIVTRQVCKQN